MIIAAATDAQARPASSDPANVRLHVGHPLFPPCKVSLGGHEELEQSKGIRLPGCTRHQQPRRDCLLTLHPAFLHFQLTSFELIERLHSFDLAAWGRFNGRALRPEAIYAIQRDL